MSNTEHTDSLVEQRSFHSAINEKAAVEGKVHSSESYSEVELHKPGTQDERIEQLAIEYGVNQRRLMMKVDFHIVPAICILYLLAFLDRVNISNAAVYGMSDDLGLVGNQYNICLTIFFVPYIVLEVPSNFLLKKFKPHIWLTLCMICFGVVSIGQGFVKNYGALVATRFLLGMFEAGMFPGCFYLLAMWYRREEAQKRYSFFFSSTCLAGAFGGLIAYGVHQLDGKQGIRGWSWIFIIEGAVTAFVALLLFFGVSDFPEDAKFLKENERAFLKAKLALDTGDSAHEVQSTVKDYLNVFKEWKVWVAGLMYFGCIIPAYGYAYFANAIISSFQYSPVSTQLHSIPPWVVAFGLSMIFAVFSDWLKHRFIFIMVSGLIAVAGFAILLGVHDNIHARYAALFLVAAGEYTAMPLIVCWTNMNFSGHYRKAVGTAWQVGFGNIGGIIATFSFLKVDAPFYTKGLALGLAFTLFALGTSAVYLAGLMRENKRKLSGRDDAKWDQLTQREQAVSGDLSPAFIYTY